jgi:hypothetical protein
MSAKQATPEQLATLTVPATLPGVVRRGTPVWAWDEDTPWAVLAVGNGEAVCAPCAGLGIPSLIDIGNLQVDLTDATGRTHVSWAIGGDVSDSRLHPTTDGGWLVAGRLYYPVAYPIGCTVPTLRGIDRKDDTRLPDGSYLVDVLALKVIALHVLGGGE